LMGGKPNRKMRRGSFDSGAFLSKVNFREDRLENQLPARRNRTASKKLFYLSGRVIRIKGEETKTRQEGATRQADDSRLSKTKTMKQVKELLISTPRKVKEEGKKKEAPTGKAFIRAARAA